VLNEVSHHKDVLGSGGTAARILILGTRRRQVVCFTPRSLLSPGKEPHVTIG